MGQHAVGIAFALLSAVTTAIPHAFLKSGKDKLAVRAALGLTQTAIVAPFCFYISPPAEALLPWLAASCVLHATYQLVLIRAYEATDFAVAYPIARGSAPIATAILGVLVLNDHISVSASAGILLVSFGILLIARGQNIVSAGLIAAAMAGTLISAYTTIDARAVRLAPSAFTFIAWFFLLDGLIMFSIFAALRRRKIGMLIRSEGRVGVAAGLASLISFGSALIALRFAPIGIVSALRETSVIFAMAVAALFLRERVDRRRIAAAIVIATGAGVIIASAG